METYDHEKHNVQSARFQSIKIIKWISSKQANTLNKESINWLAKIRPEI